MGVAFAKAFLDLPFKFGDCFELKRRPLLFFPFR